MSINVNILYQDEHYLVVDKPAGLPTHATVDKRRKNLLTLLEERVGRKLGLHHRLDRDTSGALALGLTPIGNQALSQAFAGRQAVKTYLGVVAGIPSSPQGRWKDFVKVARQQGQERLVKVAKGGDVALLDYKVEKVYPEHPLGPCALVSFHLLTGRRHQIRAQAALRGHPLIGDPLYGSGKAEGPRCLLHSWRLILPRPWAQGPIQVEATFPQEFGAYLNGGQEKRCLAFYKPFNVLSQFSGPCPEETLSIFGLPPGVYPAGRLDKDSEGLLILSDDGDFIHRLASPEFEKHKTYWLQVERVPDEEALARLRRGVVIQGKRTLPCQARKLSAQEIAQGPALLPERHPPIRLRKNVPDTWIELVLTEGRNRQARRMSAAIGHPTLRLIRVAMGKLKLTELGLGPGEFKWVRQSEVL